MYLNSSACRSSSKLYFQQNTIMEQYQEKDNPLQISVNTLKHSCICQWSPEKPQGSSSWQPIKARHDFHKVLGLMECVIKFTGWDKWIHETQSTKPKATSQWRHNGRDGVSNHQPHDCLLSRLFRHRSKKTSKLRVTGFMRGIQRWPVNFLHKEPVTWKRFPFDDVIMI